MWLKPVLTGLLGQLDQLGPVVLGLVAVPPTWVMVATGCSCRLPILGSENWTELDLKTLNSEQTR